MNSIKHQFEQEDDLLNIMRRYGETAFQRNDNEEALEVFLFIVSVTDEDTTLHEEVVKFYLFTLIISFKWVSVQYVKISV